MHSNRFLFAFGLNDVCLNIAGIFRYVLALQTANIARWIKFRYATFDQFISN